MNYVVSFIIRNIYNLANSTYMFYILILSSFLIFIVNMKIKFTRNLKLFIINNSELILEFCSKQ